jgi:methionyl-tRNA synthetase
MKYLITSALPYINGIKHLGNLVGSILPADVYSRFLKQRGHEVIFICGTDDHGTPAEIAASEQGKEVSDFCEEMYQKQKLIYEKFLIDFSFFGRSSSKYNHKLTKEVFNDLYESGLIAEKEIIQIYSNTDGRFLPDRYIVGVCPKCG